MHFPLRFNIVFRENCPLTLFENIKGVPVLPRVVHLVSLCPLCPFLCVFWFSICDKIWTDWNWNSRQTVNSGSESFQQLYWQSEQTGPIFKDTHFYYSAIWDRWYPWYWSKHRQVLCHSCFGCPPVLKHFLKHIKHGTIWDLISSFSKNDAWLTSASESSIKHSDRYVCSYLPMLDWVISQCSQWAWRG